MSATLYERLGGSEGITQIASDVVDNHTRNPAIATRFAESNIDQLKHGAATFFIQATGGPEVYEGKDMLSAHRGMNISPSEFMAVLDDSLNALQKNGIAQREQEEVLYALYSLRTDVVKV